MPLHPIIALDHIIEEYRDHILTEFRAKDTTLRHQLEQEIDRPGFLAQEPFYQAHKPYKNGKRWQELPLDPRLARVMEARSHTEHAYSHQSIAIEELLSPTARPVVVTTGTGSGKTEAFLLPVIQNAIDDSAKFHHAGLTAILVYPMNALANDQVERIKIYLEDAGFSGSVSVEQYDRSTSQAKRAAMRANPPHILLTNYMMLEYLLVRPADRDAIFANHRCRCLVMDEVHTYRGALGSNIALLVRRLRAHLGRAKQDWLPQPPEADRPRRFPNLVLVGTSATIKSISGADLSPAEALNQRNKEVREFFSKLTGAREDTIQVVSEEITEIEVPPAATYSPGPIDVHVDVADPESVRKAICAIAGVSGDTPAAMGAINCRLLWDINRWLIKAPMSATQIVERIRAEVPQRRDADPALIRKEVEAILVAGSALPDGIPNALRLRAHRFIRGGWRFHRCINPNCGRIYPMGQDRCSECGSNTAPLLLCRNCGADYLLFTGDIDGGMLRPASSTPVEGESEWVIYDPARFDNAEQADQEERENEDDPQPPARRGQVQRRMPEFVRGSFNPTTLAVSRNPQDHPLHVDLMDNRRMCLCCGGRAGNRNVITPVSLGTSAALKVLAEGTVEALHEAHEGEQDYDGKDRILIFSDSRQDAAHQARFIVFASRYDRMRRNVVRILQDNGPLTLQRVVERLGAKGVSDHDNPYAPQDTTVRITQEQLDRIRAWEEAPLLDDISVSAGYRATIANLGLVGVFYDSLEQCVTERGTALAQRLGITTVQLTYLCRCLLDTALFQGALSRVMLQYHPSNPAYPVFIHSAQWERSFSYPKGLPIDAQGHPALRMDDNSVPLGITVNNVWRGARGAAPAYERIVHNMINAWGGHDPDQNGMLDLLRFLQNGQYLTPARIHGARQNIYLFQVNDECIRLELLSNATRKHCNVCGLTKPGAAAGYPCPRCHGAMIDWTDAELEQNRIIRRIRSQQQLPLYAGEHTAQVTSDERLKLENAFKAAPEVASTNVLACSPTLEMGIDVGGLDAVAMRNIPPRPDNYAQRGGRAGRRSRIGLVLGYAGRTPHDQYFYDNPQEMISGEIPAPALSLSNRDVLLRHANAITFGFADPGLSSQMVEYVTAQGDIRPENLDPLLTQLNTQIEPALSLAQTAFGEDVLQAAGMTIDELRQELGRISAKVQDIINRTSREIQQLRQPLNAWATALTGRRQGLHAGDLVARMLGIRDDRFRGDTAIADDTSAGYPMRRFAEAGILPGYEFPVEPATLRLLGDPNEEQTIAVGRHYGIGQYQPEAQVFARTKRWKVVGLDLTSPWNPRVDAPSLIYRVCHNCELRYDAQQPACPRCNDYQLNRDLPAYSYGGFVATRSERPVLAEEDRMAGRNLVRLYPQWNGDVIGRWSLEGGWSLRLNRNEQVYWINEGYPPSPTELQNGAPQLHENGKGFYLCNSCGAILTVPPPAPGRGRQAPRGRNQDNPYGHKQNCPNPGQAPIPVAISTDGRTEILRLIIPLPAGTSHGEIQSWALSLGYSLRTGMRQLYMLDGSEIEFILEGPWDCTSDSQRIGCLSLTFIDPSIGGTGYLSRAAADLHLIAQRAITHLNHRDCDNACYRCLKTYANQRYHDYLSWPLALPYLEALAQSAPLHQPGQRGDIQDPRPWLEAYASGVGSPLELEFLKLFKRYGYNPDKQVPVSPAPGQPAISIADFALPDQRIAIYIDGASVHRGANLRRDRYIRERLRNGNPPWKVVVLIAKDLIKGKDLISEIFA